jgi:hypothetical protein
VVKRRGLQVCCPVTYTTKAPILFRLLLSRPLTGSSSPNRPGIPQPQAEDHRACRSWSASLVSTACGRPFLDNTNYFLAETSAHLRTAADAS